MKDIAFGLIRHGLTIAGGFAMENGLVSQDQSTQLIASGMIIAGIAWSILAKKLGWHQ